MTSQSPARANGHLSAREDDAAFGPVELDGVVASSDMEKELLKRAGCRGHPFSIWWTMNPMQEGGMTAQNLAKQFCKEECAVLDLCRRWTDQLEGAMPKRGTHDSFLAGVLAGEGPKERAMRRKRAEAAA